LIKPQAQVEEGRLSCLFIGNSFYLQQPEAGGKMSRLLNGQQVMAGRKP
jgi:hypothetical protein